MSTSKPYQFKAPPKLDRLFPLLLSYPIDIRSSKANSSEKRLHIDLSAVEKFDALGICIFLTNLAKIVRKLGVFEFQIRYPTKPELAVKLENIKLSEILIRLGLKATSRELWEAESDRIVPDEPAYQEFDKGRQALLLTSGKQTSELRESLIFARRKLKQFYAKNPCDAINYTQVQHILDEIIKNSIDHSNDAGLTALRFEGTKKRGTLYFVHSELGDGISLNVRGFLGKSISHEDQRLAIRGSTADFLHWAFLPGHTSKPDSGVNAGLGLSHINSAAKGGNIEVYLSDAQSIAYVTDFPEIHSHKMLRRRLYHSHPLPCFMYFGETKL